MCMHGMNHEEQHHEESLLDIVRRRHAKGEITREQFEQLRRDLGIDAPSHSAGHGAHAARETV